MARKAVQVLDHPYSRAFNQTRRSRGEKTSRRLLQTPPYRRHQEKARVRNFVSLQIAEGWESE